MTSEWQYEKLGDVTTNLDAKRKPVKEADRKHGPYPYYGASGIVDYVEGYLFDGEHLLIAEDGENLRTRQTPIAFRATGKFWVNNHAHIVVGNQRASTRYLEYAVQGTDISAYLTGAVMPKLTQGNLNRIEVPCPPRAVQDSIVAVLGNLDDRITLLRETNQTLEAIAQALFKSWFVDFDPVRAKAEGRLPEGIDAATAALFPDAFEETELGLVPKGWGIGRLIDIAKLKGGKMLSKEHFSVDGEFPVYGGAGEMGRSNLSNAEGFVITVGRVGAYCGQYFWHSGKAWVNNNASRVIPHNENNSVWLYQWLRSVDMDLIKKGAAQPFVSNGDIENLKIILPVTSVIKEFVNVCEPIFERMSSVLASISTLTNLRDSLLPRLISGQLRIADAEAEIGKATA